MISKQTNNAGEWLSKCKSVNSSDVSQQTTGSYRLWFVVFSRQRFFNQVYMPKQRIVRVQKGVYSEPWNPKFLTARSADKKYRFWLLEALKVSLIAPFWVLDLWSPAAFRLEPWIPNLYQRLNNEQNLLTTSRAAAVLQVKIRPASDTSNHE